MVLELGKIRKKINVKVKNSIMYQTIAVYFSIFLTQPTFMKSKDQKRVEERRYFGR